MAGAILIAESGATKAEWCLLTNGRKTPVVTQGISPYFFTEQKIIDMVGEELFPHFPKSARIEEIHYYGTGMRNPDNVKMIKRAFHKLLPDAEIEISDDMLAAARALNGTSK